MTKKKQEQQPATGQENPKIEPKEETSKHELADPEKASFSETKEQKELRESE